MYPVSSGFEECIHRFCEDSFGQKRETLLGRLVIHIEPSLARARLSERESGTILYSRAVCSGFV